MSTGFKTPVLQRIDLKEWNDKGLDVSVLREDLVHPFISGNKWRKLKYNLVDFKNSGKDVMLTFGGPFSNHLVATAAASRENKFKSIGIIRGEKVDNNYLDFICQCGMILHFISRDEYRKKTDEDFLRKILDDLVAEKKIRSPQDVFVLPEGGANEAAVRGASEIMDEVPGDSDFIACACGTGATLAGISKRLLPNQHAIGVSVLKAPGYFENQIENLGGTTERISINNDYHFGGYAKKNKLLEEFCSDFLSKTNIPIEPVYTGKLFFAINEMIRSDYFKRGTKVTLIHTGGVFNFNKLIS